MDLTYVSPTSELINSGFQCLESIRMINSYLKELNALFSKLCSISHKQPCLTASHNDNANQRDYTSNSKQKHLYTCIHASRSLEMPPLKNNSLQSWKVKSWKILRKQRRCKSPVKWQNIQSYLEMTTENNGIRRLRQFFRQQY